MPIPAYVYDLCTGIRSDGTECHFYIKMSAVEKVMEHGPTWKAQDMWLLDQVLQQPQGIYEHLGREDCDAACCHYAKIKERWLSETEREPAPEGYYFVVYTEPTSGGMIVWDWGWRLEDKSDPSHVDGWQSFGRGRVWSKP